MPDKKQQDGYTSSCADIVQLVQFFPYDWASNVLAIATPNRLTIASVRFPEEDSDLDDLEYQVLKEFHHDKRITAVAWSPLTSLLSLPPALKLYTAGSDHKIYMYGSDMDNDSTKELIGDHRDYVNALAVHPNEGQHVASVSDDLTCRVWSPGGDSACFPLTSPGVSVAWHSEHPEKLMVAEQKGLIRMYNFNTQRPIMSLDCGHVTLSSADWCPTNALHIACVAASDWFVFDTSRSSLALENKSIHTGGCSLVRWSRSQRHVIATTGQPNSQLKVTNIHTNQTLLVKDHVISAGLSWHYRLPILAVGGDNKVHYYRLQHL